MVKKICKYRSAVSCGYLETKLTPCPDCPFGKEDVLGKEGLAGPPGKAGPQGDQGDIGLTGPTGPGGIRGEPGPPGTRGIMGLTGPPGTGGSRGGVGPEGDRGAKGPAGEPGEVDEDRLKKLIKSLLERLQHPQLLLGWGARAKHANLPDVTSGQHHTSFVQADADILYDVFGGLATHEGAADPHAVYLTAAEHTTVGDSAPHHAAESGESATHNHGNLYYTETEHGGVSPQGHHNVLTIGADAAHSLATQVLSAVIAATDQIGHMSTAMFDKLAGIAASADVTGDNPPQSHDYDVHSGGVPYAELEYDDATSDPLIDGAAAADGTETSAARKDHVHPAHHAQAHGPSDHTEGTAWRLVYQDVNGDEQEIALGTDGQVLTSTGAALAPQFENLPAAGAHGPAAHTEFATWKIIYTDASGDQQELALGTDGQVLTSTGAATAPAFESAAGGTSHAMLGAYYPGVLSTGIKTTPQVPYRGDTFTIDKLYCRVAVAPQTQAITVNIRRNGTSMGTVTIAGGANTGEADVDVEVSTGDYFDINITQVGQNPNEGSDLVWLVVP